MPSECYDHDSRSRPPGPLGEPPAAGYRVRYRGLPRAERYRIGTALLMALAPALAGLLLLHMLWPTHWSHRGDGRRWLMLADSVTLVSVALLELFLLVHVLAVALAVSVARDPVPVRPERGTGLAFLVTYLPGRDRLPAVRATLEGAVRVRHPGPLDVWLLDESDDPEARMLCAELGVHHFTRLGVPEGNQVKGPHRAGARHGNYNAWLAKHGAAYDFFASVATGHVPRPGFLERMTGYFRDPDIAFAVGPRVHRSAARAVTGSPHSLFHELIQRAGNRYGAPVLAGTGRVVRVTALRRAGGFHDSVAGDMATGFELHRTRNPLTGRHWRSVHIPDAPAVEEVPAVPVHAFPQRLLRSREAYGVLLRQCGQALLRVPPGRLLGYTLTLVRRPVAAVGCLFGVLSCLPAFTHEALRPWAVLAMVTAFAPAMARPVTLLRRRRARAPRPVRATEPAPAAATAAGTGSTPVPGL